MNSSYYSSRQNRSDSKWLLKLALLLFIFAVAVLKNSGCASMLITAKTDAPPKEITINEPQASPLSLSPESIELASGEESRKTVYAYGGKKPYAFFLKQGSGLAISILDSQSALIKLGETEGLDKPVAGKVYVLDASGNLASATVSVSARN